MKNRIPVFMLLLGGAVSGCYQDKGEYDYTPLNWIDIDYLPSAYISISNDNVIFQYRQPLTEVESKSIVPVLKQDLAVDESQLSFYWINTSGEKDTLEQKEFQYELLPRQATNITRLLKITDHSTQVDYYRVVDIKTVPPYKDQWLVLHGAEGDRRLGAAENMDGKPLVTADCYELQHGYRRFQHAIGLNYVSLGKNYTFGEFEVLQIFEPDSCFAMYPFLMRVDRVNEEMMVGGIFEGLEFQQVVHSESSGSFWGVMTNMGLLLSGWGDNYSPVGKEEGIADFTIDDIYLSAGGYATIWDGLKHRFLSYKFQVDKMNKLALVNPKLFEGVDLTDKTCRAFLASTASPDGVMAIMQDREHSYWYELNYNWRTEKLPGAVEAGGTTFRKDTLRNMSFDEYSCFAANGVFQNQFFYSAGTKIYRYNMINQENLLLYNVREGSIDKMFFKSYYPELAKYPEFTRILGIVVNHPDGKGEVHEVTFTTAGEVEKSIVFQGFGPIVDLISAQGL